MHFVYTDVGRVDEKRGNRSMYPPRGNIYIIYLQIPCMYFVSASSLPSFISTFLSSFSFHPFFSLLFSFPFFFYLLASPSLIYIQSSLPTFVFFSRAYVCPTLLRDLSLARGSRIQKDSNAMWRCIHKTCARTLCAEYTVGHIDPDSYFLASILITLQIIPIAAADVSTVKFIIFLHSKKSCVHFSE